jgi:hypothetical protein
MLIPKANCAVEMAFLLLVSLVMSPNFSNADENQSDQAPVHGSSGASHSMNPDISLDGLFDFSQFNKDTPSSWSGGHDPKENGFTTQQVELTFGSVVDPYFRADANLVLVPENGKVNVEIEEAYATSLDFPWNLQLKAGAFFTAFGRNNPVHPHAWDFVNKPLVLGRMFGGDGLRNPGLQLSWLSPLPWYSEVITSAQNSTGGTAASFRADAGNMRAANDVMALLKWNNFFDLSDQLAMNLGTSFITGPNATPLVRRTTKISGGDLYLKYRIPSSMSYVGLQFEALNRNYDTADRTLQDWGWYGQLVWRLPEPWHRWVLGLRYDWLSNKPIGSPNTSNGIDQTIPVDTDGAKRYRVSPNITFFPSEFTKVRLQYDYDKQENITAQQAINLEFEFIIGAHGAHKF